MRVRSRGIRSDPRRMGVLRLRDLYVRHPSRVDRRDVSGLVCMARDDRYAGSAGFLLVLGCRSRVFAVIPQACGIFFEKITNF
jgi:hypothetical protein